MFGKNAVAAKRTDDFLVHSLFYTIQGEGPHAGKPAIFLRLGGCNLRCWWCDTEFERGAQVMSAEQLSHCVQHMAMQNNCPFIVITGGEPMLQPLPQLFPWFTNEIKWLFQIETAGTVWPDGMEQFMSVTDIVCSPKAPRVHPMVDKWARAWKYIIRVGEVSPNDGLPCGSTQPSILAHTLHRPTTFDRDRIFVQPCDEHDPARSEANMRLAAAIAMKHGYRLSLQMHKIAGLD